MSHPDVVHLTNEIEADIPNDEITKRKEQEMKNRDELWSIKL